MKTVSVSVLVGLLSFLIGMATGIYLYAEDIKKEYEEKESSIRMVLDSVRGTTKDGRHIQFVYKIWYEPLKELETSCDLHVRYTTDRYFIEFLAQVSSEQLELNYTKEILAYDIKVKRNGLKYALSMYHLLGIEIDAPTLSPVLQNGVTKETVLRKQNIDLLKR